MCLSSILETLFVPLLFLSVSALNLKGLNAVIKTCITFPFKGTFLKTMHKMPSTPWQIDITEITPVSLTALKRRGGKTAACNFLANQKCPLTVNHFFRLQVHWNAFGVSRTELLRSIFWGQYLRSVNPWTLSNVKNQLWKIYQHWGHQ